MNIASEVIKIIHKIAKREINHSKSFLMYGTVQSVNPLVIMAENGIVLESDFLFPSDSVIVKKVKILVHRVYGQPKEVHFTGNANEISNSINMLLYNENKEAKSINFAVKADNQKFKLSTPIDVDGEWRVATELPPDEESMEGKGFEFAVSGDDPDKMQRVDLVVEMQEPESELTIIGTVDEKITTARLMEMFEMAASVTEDVAFRIEFIEEAGNEFKIDEAQQNHTVAIEGILWCGLAKGDEVMMTTYNDNQRYLIHRILNRPRGENDYEQAIGWSNRVSDGQKEGGHR